MFPGSIATLGLNGDGVGLNYHDGLFLQKFSDNKQWKRKSMDHRKELADKNRCEF